MHQAAESGPVLLQPPGQEWGMPGTVDAAADAEGAVAVRHPVGG